MKNKLYRLLNEMEERDYEYNVIGELNDWLNERNMFVADTTDYLTETLGKFKEMSLDDYVKDMSSKVSTLTEEEYIKMNRKIESIQLEHIHDILYYLLKYDIKLVKKVLKKYEELNLEGDE